MQPDPQNSEQMLDVDRFRDVIGRASFNALFTVAFHRFRRQRNDR